MIGMIAVTKQRNCVTIFAAKCLIFHHSSPVTVFIGMVCQAQ